MTKDKVIKKQLLSKKNIVILLFIICFICTYISFAYSRYYQIPIKDILGSITSLFYPIEPFWDQKTISFSVKINFPRIILAFLVGSSLSVSGATYQGIFKNPMASPDILAASNGAAFGAAFAIVNCKSNFTTILYAFYFSLIAVFLVCLISKVSHGDEILTLVLSGILVSSLFSGATTYLKFCADPENQIGEINAWLMGSLNLKCFNDVKFAILPTLLGLIPLYLIRWKMNILTLGDDEAKAIGINPDMLRFFIIIFSTLAISGGIAVCGKIGWVGLIIPHIARHIVGCDYKYLVPASIALGSTFLLILDFIARNLAGPVLPLGVLNAFVGAPFFLYLIATSGRK